MYLNLQIHVPIFEKNDLMRILKVESCEFVNPVWKSYVSIVQNYN